MLQRARAGAIAGIAGGVVFGMMMGMMGMLPVIASMVGSSSAIVGFVIHLMMSAMIGGGFGVVGHRSADDDAAADGRRFGAGWTASAVVAAMPSLMGHVIYGVITGFTFRRLSASRAPKRALRTA